MLTALLTGLNERRRELAILRSVGARPGHLFGLILGEALFLTGLGAALGLGLLYLLLALARPWVETQFGIHLGLGGLSAHEVGLLAAVGLAGALAGAIPAWRAYRLSLTDGLSPRV
jgi:putative ABC transport system permease protein